MILGISGKMGSGKTTLADHIVLIVPGCVRKAFGDPLKIEASLEYGFPLDWAYRGKDRVVHSHRGANTVRDLLQYWGTDVRRAQDPIYWLKAMDKYVGQDLDAGAHVVVDDVRFENEADWVLARGGVLVRVDTYDGWVPGPFSEHVSETDLDDYELFTKRIRPPLGGLSSAAVQLVRELGFV